jgi:hypothetical protein
MQAVGAMGAIWSDVGGEGDESRLNHCERRTGWCTKWQTTAHRMVATLAATRLHCLGRKIVQEKFSGRGIVTGGKERKKMF